MLFKARPFLITLLVLFVLLSFCGTCLAQDKDLPANTITVTGEGTVKVAPDTAEIDFAVVTDAAEAQNAQAANVEISHKVIAALQGNGIAAADISTLNYSLYPNYVYKENQPPKLTGYEVTNEIKVTIRNLDKIGAIIDLAVKNGINRVQNINFYANNSTEQKIQALRQAVSDARIKADTIAASLGKKIVGVKSASGSWFGNQPTPIYYGKKEVQLSLGGGAATDINPGQIEITANAEVAYLID
ncbi:MAG TPA: hypothetical protein DCK76_01170 [Desulfotomaculum sp.]|nr:MAG: hypothetical protein XD84_1646 [Desulfotomaculum sp. 46_80]HAG10024.1 hypothetical protein [Desulfotomaculum sp.]HBY04528.1 hypothetical protein [Desulfotomaculum sp.]